MCERRRLCPKRPFGDRKVQSGRVVEDLFGPFPISDGDGKVGENGVVVKGQPDSGVLKQGNVVSGICCPKEAKWVLEVINKNFRGNPL